MVCLSGDDNDEKTLKITEDQARNAEKGVYARKWEKCTVDALQQAAGPGEVFQHIRKTNEM